MSKATYPAGIAAVINAANSATPLVYKLMLVDSGYTFDPDEAVMTVPGTSEISGTGYTAGGMLTTLTAAAVPSSDECLVDNTDEEWTGYSAGEVKAAILYIVNGSYATDIPVMYIDEGFPLNGATIKVETPNGLFGIPSALA